MYLFGISNDVYFVFLPVPRTIVIFYYFLWEQLETRYLILNFIFYLFSAHEITHAFDEVGIMYNSEGLFQPLYDNETIEAFNNASDCIRQQYSTFSAAGMYVLETDHQNLRLGWNV